MRKPAVIFLLLLFASTTEVGQLLKLPLLISHFMDHYNEEGQSVYAFLHEHYVHHHGANTDKDEDDRLPFKTTNIQQTSFTYLLPCAGTIDEPEQSVHEIKIALPSAFLSFDYLKDIFHPPRIV